MKARGIEIDAGEVNEVVIDAGEQGQQLNGSVGAGRDCKEATEIAGEESSKEVVRCRRALLLTLVQQRVGGQLGHTRPRNAACTDRP